MTNRLLKVLVVFVMVLACIFAVTSCKKSHQHSYSASNVAATCTEAGYTVYKCDCGDSYTEAGAAALGHALTNQVGKDATCSADGYSAHVACTRCNFSTKEVYPAIGHCYAITNIVYPGPTNDGSKELVCEMCGQSKVEAINASSFALPMASDILGSIICGVEVAIAADPDTVFIISEEPSDYAVATGTKAFYAIKLCQASLSNNDGDPQGFIKIQLGLVNCQLDGTVHPDDVTMPSNFDTVGSIYIYVNGENLAIEIESGENKESQSYNLTELLYTIVGEAYGLSYEDVLKVSYTYSEFIKVVPSIVGLIQTVQNIELPTISVEYADTLVALMEQFSEKFVVSTTTPDGQTVMTTDLAAFSVFIDSINGKTLGQYLDEAYGAGSAESVKSFIIGLPDMKIKEIANSAITAAEAYGVNVDDIYSFIDLLVYVTSGTQVSIKYEIEKNYYLSLSDIIASQNDSDPDFDKATFVAELKQELSDAVNKAMGLDFNQLFNYAFYGDPDYKIEGETETFKFLDQLKAVLGELNEMVYVTVVTDAEGMFVSMNFAFGNFNAMIERVIETDDAHIVISTEYQGLDLTLDVTVGETGLSFTFNKGADEMASGFFKIVVNDEFVEDEYGNVYYNEISREVTAAIFANDKQYLNYATYSEYGVTEFVHLEVNYDKTEYVTYPDPENYEYVSETVVTFTNLILIDIVSGDTKDTVYVQIGDFIADIEYVYGADRDTLTFDIGEIEGTIYYSEEIDGEDTISTTEGIIYYYEFTLADFEIERVNGVVRNAAALVNVIETENVIEESIGGEVGIRTERYISESLIISYTANDEGFTLVIVDADNTSAEIRITYDDANGFVVAVNANVDGAMENMIRLSLKGEGDDLHVRIDTAKLLNYSFNGYDDNGEPSYTIDSYIEVHGGLTITVKLPEVDADDAYVG